MKYNWKFQITEKKTDTGVEMHFRIRKIYLAFIYVQSFFKVLFRLNK